MKSTILLFLCLFSFTSINAQYTKDWARILEKQKTSVPAVHLSSLLPNGNVWKKNNHLSSSKSHDIVSIEAQLSIKSNFKTDEVSQYIEQFLSKKQKNTTVVNFREETQIDSTHIYILDDFAEKWILSQRIFFSYENNREVEQVVWQLDHEQNWVKHLRIFPTYTDIGDVATLVYQNWNETSQEWTNFFRLEFIYEMMQPVSILIYYENEEGEDWLLSARYVYTYQDDLLQEEQYETWDEILQEWSVLQVISYEYDEEGRRTRRLLVFQPDSENPLQSQILYLNYEGELHTHELIQTLTSSGEWVNNSQTFYTYEAGILEEREAQYWDVATQDWKNTSQILYTYNDNQELTNETNNSWEAISFTYDPQTRFSSDYSSEGLQTFLLREVIDAETGEWKNDFLITLEYNENNDYSAIQFYADWNGDIQDWNYLQGTFFFYDDNGFLIRETWQNYDSSLQEWVNVGQKHYANNDMGQPLMTMNESWGGENWIFENKSFLEYNEMNLLIANTNTPHDVENPQDITEGFRYLHTYTQTGQTATTVQQQRLLTDEDWTNTGSDFFSYNDDEQLIQQLRQHWNGNLEQWENDARTLQIYDENGFLIERREEEWTEAEIWQEGQRWIFENNEVGKPVTAKENRGVYPNFTIYYWTYEYDSQQNLLQQTAALSIAEEFGWKSVNQSQHFRSVITSVNQPILSTINCDFPNPYTLGNNVYCTPLPQEKEYEVEVYNLLGQLEFQTKTINEFSIPSISGEGMYVLKIQHPNGLSWSQKIYISH